MAGYSTWWKACALFLTCAPLVGGPSLAQTPPRQVQPSVPARMVLPNPVRDEPPLFANLHELDRGLAGVTPRRRVELSSLRANPTVTMGAYKVDFRPLLGDTKSLLNQGAALRANPQLAMVGGDKVELLEAEQGIVVVSQLVWRLKPGACLTPQTRSRLAEIGAPCFSKTSESQRVAAFSDKTSLRYIADPDKRAKAIANYRSATEAEGKAVVGRIADIRRGLADPARSAALIAKIGAAEHDRLKQLSDDDLEQEIVNSGETAVEQVLYVPFHDSLAGLRRVPGIRATPGAPGAGSTPQAVAAAAQRSQAPDPKSTPSDADLGPFVFLNGFTLGRKFEWKQSIGITIDWCFWDSCPTRYYVEPFAELTYGLGLRLPIKLQGHYSYRPGSADPATVKIDFQPIDATSAQYGDAGLASDKLFDGQELVAELSAQAGVRVKLPVWGRDEIAFSAGFDLTDMLGGDFRGGHFKPPAAGSRNIPSMEQTFPALDLLGGIANLGVAGARITPAVKIGLASQGLSFTLNDKVSNRQQKVTATGKSHSVAVDGSGHSDFFIGDPVYNLSFRIEPGLAATVWVDVALWEKDKSWTLWFPQLAVDLPPGGIDFGCHEGTICRHEFKVTAYGAGAGSVASTSSSNECEAAGKHEGRLALKSELTGKYLRGGMPDGLVHAAAERIGGDPSWETFDMYDFGSVQGSGDRKVALRSTQDPRRWMKVTAADKLELLPARCTTGSPEFLFAMRRDPPPSAATVHLRSLKNDRWLIERSTGLVQADAVGLGGTTPKALSFRWEAAPTLACDSGRALGRFALRSELTGKYVRGGVTFAGSQAAVAAASDAIGGTRSWETFDLYDVGGLGWLRGSVYALRSTVDPSRWLQVGDRQALELVATNCSTIASRLLFKPGKLDGAEHLRSLYNSQWVIQRSNGVLFANAESLGGNVEKALLFRLVKQ
ncbi:MAG: hypothetical protein WCI56_15865 [Hyphomicrobiales bacterium]